MRFRSGSIMNGRSHVRLTCECFCYTKEESTYFSVFSGLA